MKKKQTEKPKRGKGLFDHINALFLSDKNYFTKLSDPDKKSFSTYMVNRFLSMHQDLIDAVNYFQRFNHDLEPSIVFKLYYDILPKKKLYLKYIKAVHETKVNPDLVTFLSEHYRVSKEEAEDYLRIYLMSDTYKVELIHLLQSYGYDLQKIQELMK